MVGHLGSTTFIVVQGTFQCALSISKHLTKTQLLGVKVSMCDSQAIEYLALEVRKGKTYTNILKQVFIPVGKV